MMHKLFWKIFLSFWLSSSIIIISTIWVTGIIHRQATIPAREKQLLNNYAFSAIASYQSGQYPALKHWMAHVAEEKALNLYLITPNKIINPPTSSPKLINQLQKKYQHGHLKSGVIREKHFYVSPEIITLTGQPFRLITLSNLPIQFSITAPWQSIFYDMIFAIIVSGISCLFLSRYLTRPIANLCTAARKIAYGQLDTRLDKALTSRQDEIGELSQEFNYMAQRVDSTIKAKERLLQDISHELRSPLARMQIALGLCQRNKTASNQENFNRIEKEIQRLDALISDILSLAKFHDPSKQIEKKKTDLTPIVNEICQDAAYEFGDKHIQLKQVCQSPCFAYIDSKLMHCAIENIIRNALRYTAPNTTVLVQLSIIKDEVCLMVRDQGAGVPPEELLAIFNAFYRVDNARASTTGGYGIGLALTKKIIELHQGQIEARNISPSGLEVTFQLPVH